MLGKNSGVAAQIKEIQPKAVETHCHGYSLSLSVKDAMKSSRLLSDIMGTVAEITTLIKYSPKRENLLGKIKENLEFDDEEDDYESINSLTKLCVNRWTVRATAFKRVMDNYQQLHDLWEECLQESLDRETRSRIIGCQSQMTLFRFFYGLNLGHTVFALTDNLSKTLQKESLSAIESKEIALLTIQTLQNMRNEKSAHAFLETVKKKSSKYSFIEDPVLPRKRRNPNYKSLTEYFVV